LDAISHSVRQCFTVPSAVQSHELLHSSMYNRASVFLFHDFEKMAGTATISDWEQKHNFLQIDLERTQELGPRSH